jgi:hypothetical protein
MAAFCRNLSAEQLQRQAHDLRHHVTSKKNESVQASCLEAFGQLARFKIDSFDTYRSELLQFVEKLHSPSQVLWVAAVKLLKWMAIGYATNSSAKDATAATEACVKTIIQILTTPK